MRLETLTAEEIAADVAQRQAAFRADLPLAAPVRLMRKWLLHGTCFALSPGRYYDVRQAIADSLCVHSTNVVMVGSGKLGFSISPEKLYRPFGDDSDFDMAVVSRELYEVLWLELFTYFETNAILDKSVRNYHMRGWLRPDMFPESPSVPKCNELRESVKAINGSGIAGRYPVNIGVYHSWPFLEGYQTRSIANCIDQEVS